MALLPHDFNGNQDSATVEYGGDRGGPGKITMGVLTGGNNYSGTLTVNASDDGGTTFFDLELDIDVSTTKSVTFDCPPGTLKMTLAGGTSPDFTAILVSH